MHPISVKRRWWKVVARAHEGSSGSFQPHLCSDRVDLNVRFSFFLDLAPQKIDRGSRTKRVPTVTEGQIAGARDRRPPAPTPRGPALLCSRPSRPETPAIVFERMAAMLSGPRHARHETGGRVALTRNHERPRRPRPGPRPRAHDRGRRSDRRRRSLLASKHGPRRHGRATARENRARTSTTTSGSEHARPPVAICDASASSPEAAPASRST